MLFNYFKITIRNLLKYKSFSLINLLGLSFSMSVCLLIITIINDQLSHDTFHKNKDRIYRVISDISNKNDRSYFTYATTPMPMAGTLQQDYQGVENAVWINKSLLGDAKAKDKHLPVKGIFANHSFLDIFSFDLKAGNPETALDEPYSVLLSEETAQKFFEDTNPVGKMIEIGVLGNYTVTGIIKDTPSKSHIKFDLVGSGSTLPIIEKMNDEREKVIDNWNNPHSSYVYILLEQGVSADLIESHLSELSEWHASTREETYFDFQLQHLSDITPSRLMNNAFAATIPIEALIALGILAAIVIFSACFNYTNLSIARALTRAKEVGVRKVTGAMKGQLIFQFLSESILFAIISLIFAMVMHQYLLDAFNQLHVAQEVSMRFDENVNTYLFFFFFSIIAGIIAGIVPAFFLSSFKPISVLKNLSGTKFFSRLFLRKSLIVVQFTLSLFFILTTIIIHKQSNFMINSDYGFTKENIINIPLKNAQADLFINEVKKRVDVIEASSSSHIPATGSSWGAAIYKDMEEPPIRFDYFSVDQQYINNLKLELVAGTNFPDQISDQHEQYIIINEKGAELLQFSNPQDAIGQQIYTTDTTLVQIIGVIKDYNFRIKLMDVGGLCLRYIPNQFHFANIKIDGSDTEATIAGLEKTWKQFDQEHAFEFSFLDQDLEEAYGFVKDLRSIIGITAILTMIIATLGLMGMAIFNVESRIKEVGIRKILGAAIPNIFILLSKGYFMLIFISIALATPLAYFVNSLWLQEAASRISIGAGIIFSGIFILIALGLLTIGSQSLRAAFVNPVNSLRNE